MTEAPAPLTQSKRGKSRAVDAVVAPKYIVKTLANGSATASCDIFYDKQTLCSELQDSMNKYDLIVQQFISQKTL